MIQNELPIYILQLNYTIFIGYCVHQFHWYYLNTVIHLWLATFLSLFVVLDLYMVNHNKYLQIYLKIIINIYVSTDIYECYNRFGFATKLYYFNDICLSLKLYIK